MWKDFKPGTILWGKIMLGLLLLLLFSYLLSLMYPPLIMLLGIYFLLFVFGPMFFLITITGPVVGFVLGILFFPFYLWLLVNFILLRKKKKAPLWMTILAVILTILFLISLILAGILGWASSVGEGKYLTIP